MSQDLTRFLTNTTTISVISFGTKKVHMAHLEIYLDGKHIIRNDQSKRGIYMVVMKETDQKCLRNGRMSGFL